MLNKNILTLSDIRNSQLIFSDIRIQLFSDRLTKSISLHKFEYSSIKLQKTSIASSKKRYMITSFNRITSLLMRSIWLISENLDVEVVIHTIKYSHVRINFTEDFHRFKKSTDVKDFHDSVILSTSEIDDARSMFEVINIEIASVALIMMTVIVNAAIIFLNHNNLYFDDALKVFIMRSCISDFIWKIFEKST